MEMASAATKAAVLPSSDAMVSAEGKNNYPNGNNQSSSHMPNIKSGNDSFVYEIKTRKDQGNSTDSPIKVCKRLQGMAKVSKQSKVDPARNNGWLKNSKFQSLPQQGSEFFEFSSEESQDKEPNSYRGDKMNAQAIPAQNASDIWKPLEWNRSQPFSRNSTEQLNKPGRDNDHSFLCRNSSSNVQEGRGHKTGPTLSERWKTAQGADCGSKPDTEGTKSNTKKGHTSKHTRCVKCRQQDTKAAEDPSSLDTRKDLVMKGDTRNQNRDKNLTGCSRKDSSEKNCTLGNHVNQKEVDVNDASGKHLKRERKNVPVGQEVKRLPSAENSMDLGFVDCLKPCADAILLYETSNNCRMVSSYPLTYEELEGKSLSLTLKEQRESHEKAEKDSNKCLRPSVEDTTNSVIEYKLPEEKDLSSILCSSNTSVTTPVTDRSRLANSKCISTSVGDSVNGHVEKRSERHSTSVSSSIQNKTSFNTSASNLGSSFPGLDKVTTSTNSLCSTQESYTNCISYGDKSAPRTSHSTPPLTGAVKSGTHVFKGQDSSSSVSSDCTTDSNNEQTTLDMYSNSSPISTQTLSYPLSNSVNHMPNVTEDFFQHKYRLYFDEEDQKIYQNKKHNTQKEEKVTFPHCKIEKISEDASLNMCDDQKSHSLTPGEKERDNVPLSVQKSWPLFRVPTYPFRQEAMTSESLFSTSITKTDQAALTTSLCGAAGQKSLFPGVQQAGNITTQDISTAEASSKASGGLNMLNCQPQLSPPPYSLSCSATGSNLLTSSNRIEKKAGPKELASSFENSHMGESNSQGKQAVNGIIESSGMCETSGSPAVPSCNGPWKAQGGGKTNSQAMRWLPSEAMPQGNRRNKVTVPTSGSQNGLTSLLPEFRPESYPSSKTLQKPVPTWSRGVLRESSSQDFFSVLPYDDYVIPGTAPHVHVECAGDAEDGGEHLTPSLSASLNHWNNTIAGQSFHQGKAASNELGRYPDEMLDMPHRTSVGAYHGSLHSMGTGASHNDYRISQLRYDDAPQPNYRHSLDGRSANHPTAQTGSIHQVCSPSQQSSTLSRPTFNFSFSPKQLNSNSSHKPFSQLNQAAVGGTELEKQLAKPLKANTPARGSKRISHSENRSKGPTAARKTCPSDHSKGDNPAPVTSLQACPDLLPLRDSLRVDDGRAGEKQSKKSIFSRLAHSPLAFFTRESKSTNEFK